MDGFQTRSRFSHPRGKGLRHQPPLPGMSHHRIHGIRRLSERPLDTALEECLLRVLPWPGRSSREILPGRGPRVEGFQTQKGQLRRLPQSRQQREIRIRRLLGEGQTRPRLTGKRPGSSRRSPDLQSIYIFLNHRAPRQSFVLVVVLVLVIRPVQDDSIAAALRPRP